MNEVEIEDRPAFPYRGNFFNILPRMNIKLRLINISEGILIDTARNFLPVPDLKRLIDGMAHNKLNVLHIHFTDSNSFPFYSQRVPKVIEHYERLKIHIMLFLRSNTISDESLRCV